MTHRSFGSRLNTGFFTAKQPARRSTFSLSASQLSLFGFAILIMLGAILLYLPFSRTGFVWDGMLTALFISTSAVCVTGLSTVDVSAYYTPLGQVVVMLLIQLGGLGYMTLYSLMLLAVGRRLSLRDRLAMQQVLDLPGPGGVVRFILQIVKFTLFIEALGALLLACAWVPRMGWGKGLYFAVFHSISAFNNAGFSLFSEGLMGHQTDPLVLLTIAGMVILGGLGYPVLSDCVRQVREKQHRVRWRELSLHSRVSLIATATLLVLGTFCYLGLEFARPETMGAMSWPQKLLSAFFMSVMPRTAGFNALDISVLTQTSLFITLSLMLVGANPGGTGGGIKTTTLIVVVNEVFRTLRGQHQSILFRRRVSEATSRKAWATLLISVLWINFVTVLLTLTDGKVDLLRLLFEVVSAFATVGLSANLTSSLSVGGQVLIILTMYVGRVGVITAGMAIWSQTRPKAIQYPEESLLVS
ncbi:MAG: TrkH family potassium uptake protein [Candidatus Sericytochromatia bacterium]